MEDILPEEVLIWQRIERTARIELESYGFKEIRTPVLEDTSIFARSIGETTDIVKKEMYTFNDKKQRSLTVTEKCDYSFVSGTYNMMGYVPEDVWNPYVKASLAHLWSTTGRGMAFNMLDAATGPSGDGLYRADAGEFTDFCKKELSADVTLIDGYPLNEWTIFVRSSGFVCRSG